MGMHLGYDDVIKQPVAWPSSILPCRHSRHRVALDVKLNQPSGGLDLGKLGHGATGRRAGGQGLR
jgi:hypothetical protein